MSTESIMKKFVKSLPEGSFFRLSEEKSDGVVPTGITTVDFATGIGGFPRGLQSMVYGEASSGKTALCLQAIGNYQKEHKDSYSCIIDLEKSMTIDWAVKFGIDPERLVVLRPADVEEMITMTMNAIEAHIFDLIVVDSLGAGLLRTEIENDKSRMAGSAGAITRMVKAINSAFIRLDREIRIEEEKGNTTDDYVVPAVVHINQARQDLNSMKPTISYSGGKALTHMMSLIIKVFASKSAANKIIGTVDGQQMRVGWSVTATCEKNKLATAKSAGYVFVYAECPEHPFGIDNARSTSDLAILLDIARIEGKTVYYPGENGEEEKIVGRNNFMDLVAKDPKLLSRLSEEISRRMAENISDEDAKLVALLNSEDGEEEPESSEK